MLVTASREKGVLEEEEQEMLHKVFEFADKDAVDVMVPRPDVVGAAGRPAGGGDAAARARRTRSPATRCTRASSTTSSACCTCATCSRRCTTAACRASTCARSCARRSWCPRRSRSTSCWPSSSAPRTTWRSWSTSTARSEGLVTLEDLLEEIVGEIGDEFDLPDAGVLRIGRGRVRLVGSFPIDEFNERFGKHLPVDDYHTVGGFVFGELGRVPQGGGHGRLRRRPVRGQRDRRAAHPRGRRDALGADDRRPRSRRRPRSGSRGGRGEDRGSRRAVRTGPAPGGGRVRPGASA